MMGPQKFRKKPVEIEAIQWTGENANEIQAFMGSQFRRESVGKIAVVTLEGLMRAEIGDWIIKGVVGEFYPCKPDIFEATYFSAPKVPPDHALVVTLDGNDISSQPCPPDNYVLVVGPELELTNEQIYATGTRQLTLKRRSQ